MEAELAATEPLADTPSGVLQQIERHAQLQRKIDSFQAAIDGLAHFVAVVSMSFIIGPERMQRLLRSGLTIRETRRSQNKLVLSVRKFYRVGFVL